MGIKVFSLESTSVKGSIKTRLASAGKNLNITRQIPLLNRYIAASGGNVSYAPGYKIHTFNTSANLVISSLGVAGQNNLDYLIVGGGGGGGNYYGDLLS